MSPEEGNNHNNTVTVQILGERGQFCKSTVKSSLKERFRHQNLQIGTEGPDSTRVTN